MGSILSKTPNVLVKEQQMLQPQHTFDYFID